MTFTIPPQQQQSDATRQYFSWNAPLDTAPPWPPVPHAPVGGPTPPPFVTPVAPVRRNPVGLQLAALVAAVGLGVGGYWLATRDSGSSPAAAFGSQTLSGGAGASTPDFPAAGGSGNGSGNGAGNGSGNGAGSGSGSGAAAFSSVFAPFQQLVGSGPEDPSAWNGASCAADTDSSANDAPVVHCKEPDGTFITVEDVGDDSLVQRLVQDGTEGGGTVTNWRYESDGPVLGQKVVSSGSPLIVTTFDKYPGYYVAMSSSDLSTLESDWTAAPFPM